MAIGRGVATVVDIQDGQPTVYVYQTNSNHTLASAADNSVEATARAGYENLVRVFVGGDQATYTASTPTVNNTFTIDTGNFETRPTGLGLSFINIDPTTGEITIPASAATALDGVDNDTTILLRIPVTVRALGSNETYFTEASITKQPGGAVQTVEITANRYNFRFDNSASTTAITGTVNSNIQFTATGEGGSGNFVWSATDEAGTALTLGTDFTIDSTDNSRFTMTSTQFGGTRQVVTITATRGQASDSQSIYRINGGNPQIYLVPRIAAGSLVLRNNEGAATIVWDLYRDNTIVTGSELQGFTFSYTDGNGDDITNTGSAGTDIRISTPTNGGINQQIIIPANRVGGSGAGVLTINASATDS